MKRKRYSLEHIEGGGKFWSWVMDEFKNRLIVGSSFA